MVFKSNGSDELIELKNVKASFDESINDITLYDENDEENNTETIDFATVAQDNFVDDLQKHELIVVVTCLPHPYKKLLLINLWTFIQKT